MIRNLLYNGTINNDFVNSTLYSQNLLHKFISQHRPKYILHCGCPYNAISLGHFVKDTYQSEILHIKNWNPTAHHYFDTIHENSNPHQNFLNKIIENGLENHLVSFNGNALSAYNVLATRHLRFDMLVSDTINNDTDYLHLLPLIQKKNLHIRYVGHKKMSDIKHEAIFETDNETPITYAQGYLITGMDYLSLYDDQTQVLPVNVSDNTYQHTDTRPSHDADNAQHNPYVVQKTSDDTAEIIWTENGFVRADETQIATQIATETHKSEPDIKTETELSSDEARNLRREERRQAREERREQRILNRTSEVTQSTLVNHIHTAKITSENIISSHTNTDDNNDSISNSGGISATRQALRARRLARRMALHNNQDDT